MKTLILLFSAIVLIGCSAHIGENGANEKINRPGKSSGIKYEDVTQPILGERIDGPAGIRDTINGKLLFTLNDNTLVQCTPMENGWYVVGIMMDLDTGELRISKVKKGRKIMSGGSLTGEINADMQVSTTTDYKHVWTELIGYTHKDNIRPESIIENALLTYMETNSGKRTEKDFEPFIRNFGLEKDEQLEGYIVYNTYENWIADPSPMWRLGLVFRSGQLVALLHSRPLQIAETTDHDLGSGFDCLTYNDDSRATEVVKMFRHFVKQVD